MTQSVSSPQALRRGRATAPADTFASVAARRWFLGVLLVVCALNFTDRVIFVMCVQAIKEDLHVSDFQIGLAGGLTFAIFQTLLGIPLARLAERRSRTRIIAGCSAMWSLATAAGALVTNFGQFLLCRVGVGVGEAGFLPSCASLVGDRFREDRRGGAMGIIQLGSPLSAVLAGLITVTVATHYGWRAAFAVAGLPGLVAAILVWRLGEPRRGATDAVAETGEVASFPAVLVTVLRKPSFVFVTLGAMFVTVGMNGISQFLVPFYSRIFGLSMGQAAMMYAVLNSIAIAGSMLIGGYGMDWAGRIDRKWHALIPAIGVALSAIFYAVAFTRATVVVAGGFVMAGALSQFLFYVPTTTMVQNMVGPRMRASAVAIVAVVMGLIGGGIGPTLTGWLSDRFARAAFAGDFGLACPGGVAPAGSPAVAVAACRAASAHGLRLALAALCILFVASAVCYLLAASHLRKDAYNSTAGDIVHG